MDESGDLGFNFKNKKTSKYFVVTFIFVEDKGILEKMVKKVFSYLSKKEIKKHSGVLHAYKENVKTRQKFLDLFSKQDFAKVITIYLDKRKVYSKLHNEKHVLYNYITNILLDRVYSKKLIPIHKKVTIIASKRETNKFLNINFSSYLKNQTKNNHNIDIEIDIMHPSVEKGLQAVDLISWSIYRKYEHKDQSYYSLIKSHIVEENSLFG